MLLHLHSAICWLLRVRLILVPDSAGCSGHGSLDACGQCICDENYFGNMCECYYSETRPWGPRDTTEAIAMCTPDDVPNAAVCSGVGVCRCGYCRCLNFPQRYSGQYCQCNDSSCGRHDGRVCGGHGRCVCGTCECDSGYTGETCECSTNLGPCMSKNGQICNGHGDCVCGQCECESPFQGLTCEECPGVEERSSVQCNSHGSLDSCGQCVCEEGFYGRYCECHADSLNQCYSPNSTSSIVCSGRGECICGSCYCLPLRSHSAQKYSGMYCQCDDYSCSYHSNLMCGGHGVCECGKCRCEEGYTGEACECPLSPDTCMSSNGKICNGVGECICGTCVCDRDSFYRGRYCEECPTCPGKCREYKDCVRCTAFGSGPYTQEECENKCPPIVLVHVVDIAETQNNEDSHLCQFRDDEDDLRFFFTYTYMGDNEIEIEAQRTKIA